MLSKTYGVRYKLLIAIDTITYQSKKIYKAGDTGRIMTYECNIYKHFMTAKTFLFRKIMLKRNNLGMFWVGFWA